MSPHDFYLPHALHHTVPAEGGNGVCSVELGSVHGPGSSPAPLHLHHLPRFTAATSPTLAPASALNRRPSQKNIPELQECVQVVHCSGGEELFIQRESPGLQCVYQAPNFLRLNPPEL